MTIGTGIAVAAIWGATAFITHGWRETLSPLGLIFVLALAVAATGMACGTH